MPKYSLWGFFYVTSVKRKYKLLKSKIILFKGRSMLHQITDQCSTQTD